MTHRPFFLSIALFGVLAIPVQAQEVTSKAALDERTTELRKKAIDLSASVAEQLGSLQSPENRARIASNLANLLWDHDEKRSRDLLAGVEQDLRQWYGEVDDEDRDGMDDLAVIAKLRSDIVERIAKHDLKLALEFVRSTRPPLRVDADDKLEKRRYGFERDFLMKDCEAELELQLAQQAAATNPQFALQMGREMLAKDLSSNLLPLLKELQGKDKNLAANFYKAIVDQLREADFSQNYKAAGLAYGLAQNLRPPTVDEQVYRNLLGLILAGALNKGCGNAGPEEGGAPCYQIGPLISVLEKYYGARVTPLKRWAISDEDLERRDGWQRIQEVTEKGSVDELVEFAAKYPNLQDYARSVALSKAEASGDLTKAQQVAEGNPNPAERRRMLDDVEARRQWAAVSAQRSAAFQQALSAMPSDNERLGALLDVARETAARDPKGALSLLDQAAQIVYRSKSAKIQLFGQAQLALMYCSLKSDRGFAIIEALIPRLNELVAASASLDGLEVRYIRNGEWNMTGNGLIGSLLSMLALNAESFAAIDFDRAVTLTTQLQRPELRLMAQEKIAEGILAPGNYMSLKSYPTNSFEYLRYRRGF
ncbi:MAG: hypothetical protein QOD75_781 [Blastocatellia bacterium]|jgi:hypothetical protein|nr:hypothetical protein [Blastocatellia bacterium]